MVEKEIKNRRIIIKNAENDKTITDTKVMRYDSAVNSVIIPAHSILDKKFYQVYAIIFFFSCLYKFSGTIRGVMRENELEVLLGKCETMEGRQAVRYPIALEGSMEGVYIDGKKILFHKGIPIQAVDMSSSGILLKAEEGFFEIGEMYFLRVKTNMGTLKMQCEIVRIQNNGAGLEEYGCRIGEVMLFPNEEAAVKPKTEKLFSFYSGEKTFMPYEDACSKIAADAHISEGMDEEEIEKQTGYQRLHQNIGILFQDVNTELDLCREEIEALSQEIANKITELDLVDLLECINLPKPANEKMQRQALNIALLNGMQAKWLKLSRSEMDRFILEGLLQNIPRVAVGNMGLCANVTAISETYDTIISTRGSNGLKMPFDVLDMFYNGMAGRLDRKLVMSFIKNMRINYTAKQMLMSDGKLGIIRYIPFNDAGHPVVQQGMEIEQANEDWFCKKVFIEKPLGR